MLVAPVFPHLNYLENFAGKSQKIHPAPSKETNQLNRLFLVRGNLVYSVSLWPECDYRPTVFKSAWLSRLDWINYI